MVEIIKDSSFLLLDFMSDALSTIAVNRGLPLGFPIRSPQKRYSFGRHN